MVDLNLIHQLELRKDGANVHTINKAISYYRQFTAALDATERPDPMTAKYAMTLVRKEGIERRARVAITTGDWKSLQHELSDLW